MPYATVSINDKDNEEHVFENMVMRKTEPLYVGDTIEFNRFMDGCNPQKFVSGVVESVERKGRMVAVDIDIGETVLTFAYIRRRTGYDAKSNTMSKMA